MGDGIVSSTPIRPPTGFFRGSPIAGSTSSIRLASLDLSFVGNTSGWPNVHSVVFSNFFFALFFRLSANNRRQKDAYSLPIYSMGLWRDCVNLRESHSHNGVAILPLKISRLWIRSNCWIDGRGSKVQHSVIHSHIITKREGCQEKPKHKIYYQQRQMPPLHSHSVE